MAYTNLQDAYYQIKKQRGDGPSSGNNFLGYGSLQAAVDGLLGPNSGQPPAATPATPNGQQPPAATPATPNGQQPPAATPATPNGQQPPAATPATPNGQQPPAATPATPNGQQPPAATPATPNGQQAPKAATPATPNGQQAPKQDENFYGEFYDWQYNQARNPALAPGAEQTYTPIKDRPEDYYKEGQFSDTKGMGNQQVQTANASEISPAELAALEQKFGKAATYTADQRMAVQGQVDPRGLIRTQLEYLMDDVKNNDAPWADGAIRAASEAMQKRGLGQSSMAGAAIAQSILEAAVPIAAFDAERFSEVNLQNIRMRHEQLLTNQAAENAARQFNAQSQTEINKFMAGLTTEVLKFNSDMKNRMEQFNVDQANQIKLARDQADLSHRQWIAENNFQVQKANVEWRRYQNTSDTAGQNAVNMQNVMNRFNVSQQAVADLWQRTRDVFDWVNVSNQQEADRSQALALYTLQRTDYLQDRDYGEVAELARGIGSLGFKFAEDVGSAFIDDWFVE
jgi:hypothetical protein